MFDRVKAKGRTATTWFKLYIYFPWLTKVLKLITKLYNITRVGGLAI